MFCNHENSAHVHLITRTRPAQLIFAVTAQSCYSENELSWSGSTHNTSSSASNYQKVIHSTDKSTAVPVADHIVDTAQPPLFTFRHMISEQ